MRAPRRRSTWGRRKASCGRARGCRTCRARRCWPAGRAASGGFAEDMPVGEDVNFVWRLAAAGWHVRYEPRAAVGHRHRVRLGDWLRRRRDYGTSAAPLELRHPGTVPACAMSGWSALAWAAAAAGRPSSRRCDHRGRGRAARPAPRPARRRRLAARGPAGGPRDPRGRPAARQRGGPYLVAAGPARCRRRPPAPAAAGRGADRAAGSRLAGTAAADAARSYAAARLLDDLAYSVGVWQGCLAHKTARPLAPALWWWSRAGEPGGPPPGHRPSR